MAPIQTHHKRYTALERALKSGKITRSGFDHCVENGIAFSVYKAPSPEEVPLPSPALLAPADHMEDIQKRLAAILTPRPDGASLPMPSPALLAPRKSRAIRYEPFHGGVSLMSLQESLDDKALLEAEEGIRRDRVEQECYTGLWGFNILGR